MFSRSIVDLVKARIGEPRSRIQVLAGPRQVGKTFAVKQAVQGMDGRCVYRLAEGLVVAPRVWLENEWNAARVQAKVQGGFLLVIDEIQKVSGWVDVVKRLWDEDTFNDVPLKVILLGSSRLLLQRGLNESLTGRFELISADHWSFAEMRDAFGFTLDDYMLHGGYPGAAQYVGDPDRWRGYVLESIVDPSISRDILQLEQIAKPALMRQAFSLACAYSGRILSYQKMLGQLQDAGNATTLAHYLRLLGEAGLVCGLEKFYEEAVRVKASSPKLVVRNNALMTAVQPYSPGELRSRPDLWGRVVESAVGTHVLSSARRDGVDVLSWNVGAKEVDFVLRKGARLAALEVKSSSADSISGMKEFKTRYPRCKTYLVGGQGMPLETFFELPVSQLL